MYIQYYAKMKEYVEIIKEQTKPFTSRMCNVFWGAWLHKGPFFKHFELQLVEKLEMCGTRGKQTIEGWISSFCETFLYLVDHWLLKKHSFCINCMWMMSPVKAFLLSRLVDFFPLFHKMCTDFFFFFCLRMSKLDLFKYYLTAVYFIQKHRHGL